MMPGRLIHKIFHLQIKKRKRRQTFIPHSRSEWCFDSLQSTKTSAEQVVTCNVQIIRYKNLQILYQLRHWDSPAEYDNQLYSMPKVVHSYRLGTELGSSLAHMIPTTLPLFQIGLIVFTAVDPTVLVLAPNSS